MIFAEMPQWIEYLALFSMGYISLKLAFGLVSFIRVYFGGACPNFENYGSWSVVTGSTDGIGLAYAQELAKRGQKIVLISRNSEKLNATAEKLEKDFNIETIAIAADFSKSDIYGDIQDQLKGLDIGVLVNNVGTSYPYPEYFVDLPDRSSLIDRLISINVNSVVKMTEIVLPQMVSKKKGIILNISSASANPPTPMLSLYAATKQFVDCFSQCLAYEYQKKGIIIQCIMPSFVATKLSKIRRPTLMAPSPQTYVKSSLKTIGRSYRSYGYVFHAIQGAICTSLPLSIYMRIVTNLMNSARKRALKKLSSKKE